MIRGVYWPALMLAGLLLAAVLPAQTLPEGPVPAEGGEAAAAPGEDGPGTAALPRGFRGISLGMGLEALKSALERDGLFSFRGDRDVSFLPSREQSLVETTGFSFIRRAFFQLREGELFIMAFSLDPDLIDHYSVYTTLVKKYGEPIFMDPNQAVWESGDTRLAIERPLTVKYIDLRVFNDLIAESKTEEAGELFLREEFLSDF